MNIQSADEAIQILNDQSHSVLDREQAVHFLQDHGTPQVIDRLIQAMEDSHFGIRWAAAVALIQIGEPALIPILRMLSQRPDSVRLREGVHHILYYTRSRKVRELTAELVSALKGPAANVASGDIAFKLWQQLTQ